MPFLDHRRDVVSIPRGSVGFVCLHRFRRRRYRVRRDHPLCSIAMVAVVMLLVAPNALSAMSGCYEWTSSISSQTDWHQSAEAAAQARIDYCNANNLSCGTSGCNSQFVCTTSLSYLTVATYPHYNVQYRVDYYNIVSGISSTQYTNAATITVKDLGCNVFVSAEALPQAECGRSCNLVGDPINPANGSVYALASDFGNQGTSLQFERFYNSSDASDSRLSRGWRHSFSRSISPVRSSSSYRSYVSSTDNSTLYSDEALACTSGFAQIKSRVSTWANATSSYANGVCELKVGATVVGTLPILYNARPTPAPGSTSVIGYEAARDDGQLVRFWIDGSGIKAPPTLRWTLQQTAAGYTLKDATDNLETYDVNGKLTSVASNTGFLQSMGYDSSGRLNAVSDSHGHTLTLSYDAQGRLSSVARN